MESSIKAKIYFTKHLSDKEIRQRLMAMGSSFNNLSIHSRSRLVNLYFSYLKNEKKRTFISNKLEREINNKQITRESLELLLNQNHKKTISLSTRKINKDIDYEDNNNDNNDNNHKTGTYMQAEYENINKKNNSSTNYTSNNSLKTNNKNVERILFDNTNASPNSNKDNKDSTVRERNKRKHKNSINIQSNQSKQSRKSNYSFRNKEHSMRTRSSKKQENQLLINSNSNKESFNDKSNNQFSPSFINTEIAYKEKISNQHIDINNYKSPIINNLLETNQKYINHPNFNFTNKSVFQMNHFNNENNDIIMKNDNNNVNSFNHFNSFNKLQTTSKPHSYIDGLALNKSDISRFNNSNNKEGSKLYLKNYELYKSINGTNYKKTISFYGSEYKITEYHINKSDFSRPRTPTKDEKSVNNKKQHVSKKINFDELEETKSFNALSNLNSNNNKSKMHSKNDNTKNNDKNQDDIVRRNDRKIKFTTNKTSNTAFAKNVREKLIQNNRKYSTWIIEDDESEDFSRFLNDRYNSTNDFNNNDNSNNDALDVKTKSMINSSLIINKSISKNRNIIDDNLRKANINEKNKNLELKLIVCSSILVLFVLVFVLLKSSSYSS